MSNRVLPVSDYPWKSRLVKRKRLLHLMVKPPIAIGERIAELPRSQVDRSADLLHWTVLTFVDLEEWPETFVPVLLDRMRDFEAEPFELVFDQLRERNAVTMRASRPLTAAKAFQAGVVAFLLARDFPFFGRPSEPHVTINYRGDGKGNETIDPIGWIVDEVILVESIHGKQTHVVHGCWKLCRGR